MKSTAKLKSVLALALLISQIILLQACGKTSSAPDGSTISVSPSSSTLTNIIGNTMLNYRVIVRYADGTPMPYARVHISGAFAEPASGAGYQFYFYPDGDQNPNGNAAVISGFDGETDEFGVYTFSIVVYGPGITFKDTINITSGTASGSTTLDVTVS